MAAKRLSLVEQDAESDADASGAVRDLTIEQLAAETGMSVRNIRAHQARGLLPPPEVRQRVGFYGADHVARLRVISELQADGFNLKGIERLLEGASGEASEAILSFRRALTEPFEEEQPQIYTLTELRERFGTHATPALLKRAVSIGLMSPIGPASFEVAAPRLIEIAEEVLARGVPPRAMLDVLEVIQRSSEHAAEAFAQLFLRWVWQPFEEGGRPEERWTEVVESIERLRPIASEALVSVFRMTMTKTVEDEFGRELDRMSSTRGERRRKRS